MNRPDFFIVGAPKCGTTALHEYLNQHPEIFMAKKELHFFGSDLVLNRPRLTEEEYLSYFYTNNSNIKLVGEASVWYLLSRYAASEIKQFNPDAKIIIMLRNPVEMLYSLHSQRLYSGNESIEDFRIALNAENERKKGFNIPPHVFVEQGLFYTEVASYAKQVKRFLDVFGNNKVHFIIFEDFQEKPEKIFKEVLVFLGVDNNYQPTVFEKVNTNKKVRNKKIHDFLKKPPQSIKQNARKFIPYKARYKILNTIRRLNTKYESRPPLDLTFRKQLQEYFTKDIMLLSELINRDLNAWIE